MYFASVRPLTFSARRRSSSKKLKIFKVKPYAAYACVCLGESNIWTMKI